MRKKLNTGTIYAPTMAQDKFLCKWQLCYIWLLSCCYCFTDVVKSRTKVWCSSYNCAAGACTGAQLAAHMPTVCLVAFKASCLLWYCGAFLPPPPPFFFLFVFFIPFARFIIFGILYSLRKLSWPENAWGHKGSPFWDSTPFKGRMTGESSSTRVEWVGVTEP